jgi:branched-chain amino acid transport system substrate-binding protein
VTDPQQPLTPQSLPLFKEDVVKPTLRRAAAACALLLAATAAAGCGNDTAGSGQDAVRIGWISSMSGPYEQPGTDMRDGFMLYVDLHGGRLGGRDVDIVVADEGVGAADARPAAERLIRQDRVVALAGVLNADSFLAVYELVVAHELPIVGANARPTDLWDEGIEWVWTTSWLNPHAGQAIAPYIHEHVDGPVWAIGPDNQGGLDQVGGFVDEYTRLGGELANPDGEATHVPFPGTTNFVPYLSEVAASDAEAVYAFFGGAMAIDFVTQYAQSEAADLPLYGAYLTEGPVLDAQGAAAEGILNVLNYSPDLDNPANHTFVDAWQAQHDRTPTVFAMDSYDAAQVLDKAIAAIPDDREVTPGALNEALAGLGQIDSPRGSWQFSETTHAPVQRWYLREVARDGDTWSNVVVEDLATLHD